MKKGCLFTNRKKERFRKSQKKRLHLAKSGLRLWGHHDVKTRVGPGHLELGTKSTTPRPPLRSTQHPISRERRGLEKGITAALRPRRRQRADARLPFGDEVA